MVRIAGVDLPDNKRLEVSITHIYGIGRSLANKILKQADILPEVKAKDLDSSQANELRKILQSYKIEGDLRRDVSLSIKRVMDMGNYRGLRHRRRLPVRGQRTRTNARTRKGPRKSVLKK